MAEWDVELRGDAEIDLREATGSSPRKRAKILRCGVLNVRVSGNAVINVYHAGRRSRARGRKRAGRAAKKNLARRASEEFREAGTSESPRVPPPSEGRCASEIELPASTESPEKEAPAVARDPGGSSSEVTIADLLRELGEVGGSAYDPATFSYDPATAKIFEQTIIDALS